MKGIARTILLLLCWGPLQRWLLGIGLALSIGGLVALTDVWHPDFQPLFAVLVFIGIACVVISPALVGGIVFRSLSAARATGLIPYGRLKLVLGAFKSQLLVALFLAVAVGLTFSATALTPGNHLGGSPVRLTSVLFVSAYALLSIQFMGLYWSSRFPFGTLWLVGYAFWPQLFAAAYKAWHLQSLFATPAGLACAVALILLAWLVFAVWYLRARQVGVPHVDSFLLFSGRRSQSTAGRAAARSAAPSATPQYSRRKALATLLLGLPMNKVTLGVRIGCGVAVLGFLVGLPLRLKVHTPNPLLWIPLVICNGPIAGAFATSMTQRARSLWLASGLARAQLFAEVERYSWRLMLIVAALCLSLLIPQLIAGIHDYPSAVHYLTLSAIPLASGAAMIYAGMSYIRGHRLAGALMVALCTALWFIDIVNGLSGTIMPLPQLLAIQIILVPVLRLLALRLWTDIDWLLNRPKRLPVRLA